MDAGMRTAAGKSMVHNKILKFYAGVLAQLPV